MQWPLTMYFFPLFCFTSLQIIKYKSRARGVLGNRFRCTTWNAEVSILDVLYYLQNILYVIKYGGHSLKLGLHFCEWLWVQKLQQFLCLQPLKSQSALLLIAPLKMQHFCGYVNHRKTTSCDFPASANFKMLQEPSSNKLASMPTRTQAANLQVWT